jgi:fucose permease
LFVIAAGMTCLETIANPYTTVLGPPASGAPRINIAQIINGAGWIIGPIIGRRFVFSGEVGTNANAGLATPYLGIGIFVAILIVIFIVSKVPDLPAENENPKSTGQIKRLEPSSGQLAVIGITLLVVLDVLYFFISPIIGLAWALLNVPLTMLQPTKYILLVAAYVAAFLLVSKNWDLFRRKHFTLAIGTQFHYVAAQTGIFNFCVNYAFETIPA